MISIVTIMARSGIRVVSKWLTLCPVLILKILVIPSNTVLRPLVRLLILTTRRVSLGNSGRLLNVRVSALLFPICLAVRLIRVCKVRPL